MCSGSSQLIRRQGQLGPGHCPGTRCSLLLGLHLNSQLACSTYLTLSTVPSTIQPRGSPQSPHNGLLEWTHLAPSLGLQGLPGLERARSECPGEFCPLAWTRGVPASFGVPAVAPRWTHVEPQIMSPWSPPPPGGPACSSSCPWLVHWPSGAGSGHPGSAFGQGGGYPRWHQAGVSD